MRNITLIETLKSRKNLKTVGITFIESSEQSDFLSYSELYDLALQALAFLQHRGVRPGDELVFQVEDNRTFIISFWACILGGIIPVPLSIGRKNDHIKKLFNVWKVLNQPYLLTTGKLTEKLKAFSTSGDLDTLWSKIEKQFINLEHLLSIPKKGDIYSAKEEDIAFIQFSSGSTGSPKGVMLTHKNLLTNIAAIANAAAYTSSDSTLSWMPLTHDMGMIGFHINPLFSKINQYLIPTSLFVRRPTLWLDKVTAYKITISCSPNFGYEYVLKHCPASKTYDWGLSTLRLLYNGAEPISEKLCHDFLNRMENFGLKKTAMCPVYGLAEASLAVSISSLDAEMVSCQLDRSKVNFGDKVLPPANAANSISFVNVGKAINDCSIRIVDKDDKVFAEETIGHLQIKGDNVTSGYYNNKEETQKIITNDNWLDTGDLGFVKKGNLYITGRAKDIIFINGQNYYPHDIEAMATIVDGIELNKIVLAGFFNPENQKEESIAFVYYKGKMDAFISVARSLKEKVNLLAGFELDRVLPVKDIPRTTSGKLQRLKLLDRYKKGEYREVEAAMNRMIIQNDSIPSARGIAPENELEKKLLEIWQKVLPTQTIGVTHRFFALGGNSLKAAEIGMLLWQEFQVELPFELLYEKQTIRELANEINLLKGKRSQAIPLAEERSYYDLSAAQRRLYYIWELDKNSVAYNMPTAFEIKGAIDFQKLEESIQKLIVRHDALRMSFVMDKKPAFTIAKNVDFSLKSTECSREELNGKLQSLLKPFDLYSLPLFHIELLKLSPQKHLLFLDFHHIISDGFSVSSFVNELMQLYAGQTLPDMAVQFKDYVAWEKDRLQGEKMMESEAYWKNSLKGELSVLELPLDFPRPTIFDQAGEKLEFELEPETFRNLKKLAQAQNCSLHVLLLSIYRILLLKYTDQEDLIIGIPVGGRTHPDLQNIQGLFVNSLAIRNKINEEESFLSLLKREQEQMAKSLRHQEYPFDYLLQKLERKRDVSRNPVFDTMFVFQNMVIPSTKGQPLSLSRYFFDPGFAKFDLSIEVFVEDTIKYVLEYSTRLFKRETINRLSGHFKYLLEEIIKNPQDKIVDFSLLDRKEYDRYIHQLNNTQATFPLHKTVHQLFEEQVEKKPDNIAIHYNGEQITYRELNQKSNYLAALLIEKGLTRNDVVAVLLPRSPAFILSILAILKAGGSYLPLDTDLPKERIRFILEDSQCRLVLSSSDDEQLPLSTINVDYLKIKPTTPSPIKSKIIPATLAYIIYTSGTTGQPKGVMIKQRSLLNYICWAAENYVKGEKISFPLFTSVSFDLTITSVFTPLITGNSIFIYRGGEQRILLEEVVQDNKVQAIKLTPSHLRILKNSNLFHDHFISKIKRFIIGGELLEDQLARDIYELFDEKVELYNEYGPTEATVGCMIHQFDKKETGLSVPIGLPIANTQVYVLDKLGQPLPEGVKGELFVSGEGLAAGYWNKEDLTHQKFIPHFFVTGEKMYKTGDMVKWLPGGRLAYLGRRDQQVKINGYRIELAEIEQQLLGYDSISDVLVRLNKKILYAYYKCTKSFAGQLDTGMLRNYLAERLPHYMMPVHFIQLESIPLTENGKIDDSALPLADPKEERVLPENEVEEISIKIWEEVMGGEISVLDNFFELGGDSIMAVQIVSRLKGHGIVLEVKDILTYQTIKQISLRTKTVNSVSHYDQGIIAGEKELSPIESWFFSRNFENPGYYNQSVLLKLNKNVDIRRLEKAFKKLIVHHDGLRLNYNAENNKLYYNNGYLEEAFTIEKLEVSPESTKNGEGEDFSVFASLKDKFDISDKLLIRAGWLRLSENIGYLGISAHHLLIDGVSWRILLEDLYSLYKEIPLLPKTASLIHWQSALEQYATSERSREEKEYWESIENINFSIPLDMETEDWQSQHRSTLTQVLDKEQTRFLLKEAHQTYKTDVPILLNTALVLALKDWTGQNQFLIEHENHGRHLEGIDSSRTLGWFTAMYPVGIIIEDGLIGKQIRAVKEQMRKVPGQGIGYGIYKYLVKSPPTENQDLSEIRFNYLGQFGRELENDLFSYSSQYSGDDVGANNRMTTKLECNLLIVNGLLNFEVSYNNRGYTHSTIEKFSKNFFVKLQMILSHIRKEENIYFSPSDFDAVEIEQEEIDTLFE